MSHSPEKRIVISAAMPKLVFLSDGRAYMPQSEVRPDVASRYPDLIIENNIPTIRAAAVATIHQLLTLTLTLELFSFESLVTEAIESWKTSHDNPNNPN